MAGINLDLGDIPAVEQALRELRDVADASATAAAREEAEAARLTQSAAARRREEQSTRQLVAALENHLAVIRGDLPPSVGRPEEKSALEAVVSTVEEVGGPLTVAELAERLPDIKRKTIGWALWKAKETDRIQRLAKGVYAPLNYRPVELPIDSEAPWS